MNEHLISITEATVTSYRSRYGGWTEEREWAKHYSATAAELELRRLYEIAKNDEEHKYYASAKIEYAELVTF
jgi:hypothetical protein